jgi:hypothetical protein
VDCTVEGDKIVTAILSSKAWLSSWTLIGFFVIYNQYDGVVEQISCNRSAHHTDERDRGQREACLLSVAKVRIMIGYQDPSQLRTSFSGWYNVWKVL